MSASRPIASISGPPDGVKKGVWPRTPSGQLSETNRTEGGEGSEGSFPSSRYTSLHSHNKIIKTIKNTSTTSFTSFTSFFSNTVRNLHRRRLEGVKGYGTETTCSCHCVFPLDMGSR